MPPNQHRERSMVPTGGEGCEQFAVVARIGGRRSDLAEMSHHGGQRCIGHEGNLAEERVYSICSREHVPPSDSFHAGSPLI